MIRTIQSKGLTLVELIIALALVSIVGSGLFSVYWMGNKAYIRDSANSELQYMARLAMENISANILQASEWTKISEDSLYIKLVSGQEINYSLNRNKHWLYNDILGPFQPIAEKIADVKYTPVAGSNSLIVTITAADATNSFSLTSQVVPRKVQVVLGSSSSDKMPVITLVGISKQTVPVGVVYSDPGVTASDEEDGDITSRIIPNPDSVFVNTSQPTLVTITYSVSDSAGQTATVNRQVSVEASLPISGGSGPIITGSLKNAIYYWDDVRKVWTTRDPGLFDWGNLVDVQINDVIANGDQLVLVGERSEDGGVGRIANSLDGGGTWSNDIDIDLVTTKHLSSVAYGNGVYVTVGASRDALGLFTGGRILSSSDGIHWTPRTSTIHPLDNPLNSVSWGNSIFIAVGDAGDVYTSSDGVSWSKKASGVTDNLNGVFWSSKLNNWVAVGDNGRILCSSTAGSGTWEEQISGTTSELTDVTSGSVQYIAVGVNGTILKSEDGIGWETITLPVDSFGENVRSAAFKKISCAGDVFIISVDPVIKVKDPKDNVEKNVLIQSKDGGNTWLQQLVEPQ